MTKDEALDLALEALELSAVTVDSFGVQQKTHEAITALREALAEQPAQQEPVLQDIEQYRLQMAGISTAAIGYWKESDGIHPDYDTIALRDVAELYAKYDELYRAQRTWVGLTPEELDEMFSKTLKGKKLVNWVAQAIEAKLRSKNNG